jgi:prepilin-type processing-associated H-X9-DG protein
MSQIALPMFTCPSRRTAGLSPQLPWLAARLRNAKYAPLVAKTDYAICEGDYITNTINSPQSLAEGDDPNYVWPDVSKATGVCFLRSEIRMSEILDGVSQTYLIGEKYVSQPNYDTADDRGHDQCMYSGVDLDINRWTIDPPQPDSDPQRERRFGSAHAGGCQFVMCDGSVRTISYQIDGEIHRRLGNRKDGQSVAGSY